MFKKLVLSCCLILASMSVFAKQTISVVWPFGPGDTAAQYSRSLIEVLNRSQNKFIFVFENKPGAGSSIAANHVAKTPNSVMSASTAFFVRPNFFSNESHDVNKFVPIITQCAAPMLIVSGKYRSWKEIPKDKHITIAISGLGTTTNLVATEIQRQYPNLTLVPYKGIREATANLLAGDIDLQVSFFGEVRDFIELGKIYALGVTGPNRVDGVPTLISQGFAGMDQVVNMHSILAPATVAELKQLMARASKDPLVLGSYETDRCKTSSLESTDNDRWFATQQQLWKQLSDRARIAN